MRGCHAGYAQRIPATQKIGKLFTALNEARLQILSS